MKHCRGHRDNVLDTRGAEAVRFTCFGANEKMVTDSVVFFAVNMHVISRIGNCD